MPFLTIKSTNNPSKVPDTSICIENSKAGTDSWILDNPATKREIEGYASRTSVNKGESISLFVNTSSKQFSLEIFRMGWYNGKGGRSMMEPLVLDGTAQDIPLPDSETGLVECRWINPYELHTHTSWPTGIYVAKLQEHLLNKQSYILFVIRDDEKSPDIMFQLPVTTYQAYNYWGGKSLYDWGSGAPNAWGSIAGVRASHVSFNRPYARSNNKKAAHGMGAGEFFTNIQPVTTHFFPISSASWDYNMVRWLEKNGYDVGYITNIDTHSSKNNIKKSKIFMSHGHDEYWSYDMRNNVKAANDNGTNLAFFSSNTAFWQIRLEESYLSKAPNRTIVCYKDATLDPVKDHFATVNFRDKPVSNPETKLLGVQHFMDPVDGDIILSNASHSIFDNTHLSNGDKLSGLLGYEIDGTTENSPKNLVVLATSPGKNLLENNYNYILKQTVQKIQRKLTQVFSVTIKKNTLATVAIAFPFLVICILISLLGKIGILICILTTLFFSSLALLWLRKTMKKHNNNLSTKGNSHMTLYETANGAKVFASGSMQWSWGLDDYNVPQLRSSRKSKQAINITHNILAALGSVKIGELQKNGPDKTA